MTDMKSLGTRSLYGRKDKAWIINRWWAHCPVDWLLSIARSTFGPYLKKKNIGSGHGVRWKVRVSCSETCSIICMWYAAQYRQKHPGLFSSFLMVFAAVKICIWGNYPELAPTALLTVATSTTRGCATRIPSQMPPKSANRLGWHNILLSGPSFRVSVSLFPGLRYLSIYWKDYQYFPSGHCGDIGARSGLRIDTISNTYLYKFRTTHF